MLPRAHKSVLGARTVCRAARAPRSGRDRRAPALCKKCRQTPISTLLVSPPRFPRSPPSALGGRAGGARLGEARFRRLERRARERIGAFGPSAKSVGRPLFLLYQFPPHFSPTLRTRCSGAVLRARDSVSAARAPHSGTDQRAPALCKKCRQTPIFTLPVFPHFSPLSPLGAQGPCGACSRLPSGREASCGAEVPPS